MTKPEPLTKEIIELFKKAWKKKSKTEYTGSYPFTNQDNWSGKAVMDFAKFILKEKFSEINKKVREHEKRIVKLEKTYKQKIDWLLKEIEKKKENLEFVEKHGYEEQRKRAIVILEWLDWFEDLIKKAFKGVVE